MVVTAAAHTGLLLADAVSDTKAGRKGDQRSNNQIHSGKTPHLQASSPSGNRRNKVAHKFQMERCKITDIRFSVGGRACQRNSLAKPAAGPAPWSAALSRKAALVLPGPFCLIACVRSVSPGKFKKISGVVLKIFCGGDNDNSNAKTILGLPRPLPRNAGDMVALCWGARAY